MCFSIFINKHGNLTTRLMAVLMRKNINWRGWEIFSGCGFFLRISLTLSLKIHSICAKGWGFV